jgi:S-adenosylmethionine decarboxylase
MNPSIILADRPIRSVGTQWVIDAGGCEPERLTCVDRIRSICDRVVSDLNLNVIGTPASHRFAAPHGVTVLYLLSESHLACHTYPEHGLATFNFVCCRDEAVWPWQEELASVLGATDVAIRVLQRGVWSGVPDSMHSAMEEIDS